MECAGAAWYSNCITRRCCSGDRRRSYFFPPELPATVLQRGSEHEALEDYERHLVREREYRFRDVYPPALELLKKQKEYETKKIKGR